ncbi:transglutaminase domain-containing protein [Anaerosacchariphilus polymeriproducens]|uniref:Transglutaminase domain-containing protein n=1 Tax=Anaerosacchariphilus polymeriproducens TaxID=1812858 RepID=A0A371AVV7_9FIRM|nr:transglutaminase domain-containing protein [Anaerosacchariphilus polymeriproducens]RDU23610.1 transglutaminase domain-containing protein [Anaerosacchariphilus polymeriproducens]
MNIKKKLVIGILGAAVFCIVAAGVIYKLGYLQIGTNALKDAKYVSSSRLASNIKDKYADDNLYGYDYGEPIKDVTRDYVMNIELGFDLSKVEFKKWTELFGFYKNPDLTGEYTPTYEVADRNNKVKIHPPGYPKGRISTNNLQYDFLEKYNNTGSRIGTYLFDKDAGTNWGNIETVYMATYIDLKTGKKLDKPLVRVITFQGEIKESPKLSYSVTENGLVKFQWSEVEEADEYIVGMINDPSIASSSVDVIGVTNKTEWISEVPKTGDYNMNNSFKTFKVCEDTWFDKDASKFAIETTGAKEGVVTDKDYMNKEFYVIAINKDGTSMLSNPIKVSNIASNVPYQIAEYKGIKLGEKNNNSKYKSVKEMPLYEYVTMCDGYIAKKLIEYNTSEARVISKHLITIEKNTNKYIKSNDVKFLIIPYKVAGTPYIDTVEIQDYDEKNFENDMKILQSRQDELRKKSGDVKIDSDIQVKEDKKGKEQVRQVDTKITANSALSEYLAENMLGTSSIIDLSEFPESTDQNLLEDAWKEAYYQNPAILGIKGYQLSRDGNAIKIVYDNDDSTTAVKQKEIFKKVQEINSKIIKDGMTDLEKELAINQYLCDTIEYDEAALKSAEENDFKSVDENFNDSFTAYGALINGKCVCAGYSAAFKLLADAAGLESIVVTGLLDGNLAHAWNKVKVDGKWKIIDSTNNDNEYMTNALFNLPNYAGDRVLVEDEEFAIDKCLTNYEAKETESEYYRISSKYFDGKKIAEQLAKEIKEKGSTTLRTDYELNDDQFNQIVAQVYKILGDNTELYGYHWMGVIYLTTKM